MRIEGKKPNRSRKTVTTPELEEINSRYLDGTLPFESAKALAQDLRLRLDRKENGHRAKPLTLAENIKLFEAYWKDHYTWRDIKDPASMRNSIIRAINILMDLPIMTAEQTEFYKKINESGISNNRKREVIARINQLLKYARRDFTLRLPRQDYLKIRHISEPELKKLAHALPPTIATLAKIAFYTGCRVGEIYALERQDVSGKFIDIRKQMLRDGTIAKTKTRKDRTITVIPGRQTGLDEWLSIPMSQREKIRNKQLSETIKLAAKKLWPNNADKHITFHDLRHSFAIFMLGLGESLTTVAHLLGDSLQVCQMYYTGSAMADENLQALADRLKRKLK